MGMIRKFAVQGHEIPKTSYRAHGPFPPEVLAQSTSYHDSPDMGDSLHEALDNVRMFRCKECGDVLYEYHLDTHECDYEAEYSYDDFYEADEAPVYGYDEEDYEYEED